MKAKTLTELRRKAIMQQAKNLHNLSMDLQVQIDSLRWAAQNSDVAGILQHGDLGLIEKALVSKMRRINKLVTEYQTLTMLPPETEIRR